jgi:NDP-sugar pyrophosphorylase family protein
MVRIAGLPILERNIIWLRDSRINDIYVNLHHLPDIITDYFGSGSWWNVKITYSYEPVLLGTAGAVRKIASQFWDKKDTSAFLVIYGDNVLSDFDLPQITEFHSIKKGIGTICLYHKDNVSQSGVALLDNEDKIVDFLEKPQPSERTSHLVNTGIYILEHRILTYIPDGFSDFGHDIFPTVLNAKERLYGFISDRELIAVDTPELFRQAIGGISEK